MTSIFSNDQMGAFSMNKKSDGFHKPATMVSLPMMALYADLPINELPWERLFIKPKEGVDVSKLIGNIRRTFNEQEARTITFYNAQEEREKMSDIFVILSLIFDALIGMTMFLCFFSLSSSMSSNIYEQAKEIGVLRAIGFKSSRIVALYVYEAFVLVMSASLQGIIIGTLVGYTMTIQQTTFLEIPLEFFFPYQEFLLVFFISILCSFFSTYGPAK